MMTDMRAPDEPVLKPQGFHLQLVVADGDLWWNRARRGRLHRRRAVREDVLGRPLGHAHRPLRHELGDRRARLSDTPKKGRDPCSTTPRDATIATSCSTRLLEAPRTAVWRCWTEPELLKPLVRARALDHARGRARPPPRRRQPRRDAQPRGRGLPEPRRLPRGRARPAAGLHRRLHRGWRPSEKPFFVGEISLADEAGGTRYVATARHWTAEARAEHEAMGFHDGWGKAADQLEAVAAGIGG